MSEKTLAIIKPDAVKTRYIGKIIDMITAAGFRIAAMKMLVLSKNDAERFYAIHRERPFFSSLTAFMSEGAVVVMVLESQQAIQRWRDLMGATNPENASAGTIRKLFGESVERNAVHGSDSPESANIEIPFFFSQMEIN